jgi:hypothetical protein
MISAKKTLIGPDVITTAILTLGIVFGSWFVVPAPRWALVTLSASATLLLLATMFAVFPLPRRITMAASLTAFLGHVVSLALTMDTPPTLSVGNPPGRLLSSFAIQSPTHAIRCRVPFPNHTGNRMRVRLLLSKPYEGPVQIRIDITGKIQGLMQVPTSGNSSEREYIFGIEKFQQINNVVLTLQQDGYDPSLRIAIWKSDLGRAIDGVPEYITEFGTLAGLPDPVTGAMTKSWPLIWIQDA